MNVYTNFKMQNNIASREVEILRSYTQANNFLTFDGPESLYIVHKRVLKVIDTWNRLIHVMCNNGEIAKTNADSSMFNYISLERPFKYTNPIDGNELHFTTENIYTRLRYDLVQCYYFRDNQLQGGNIPVQNAGFHGNVANDYDMTKPEVKLIMDELRVLWLEFIDESKLLAETGLSKLALLSDSLWTSLDNIPEYDKVKRTQSITTGTKTETWDYSAIEYLKPVVDATDSQEPFLIQNCLLKFNDPSLDAEAQDQTLYRTTRLKMKKPFDFGRNKSRPMIKDSSDSEEFYIMAYSGLAQFLNPVDDIINPSDVSAVISAYAWKIGTLKDIKDDVDANNSPSVDVILGTEKNMNEITHLDFLDEIELYLKLN